MNTLQNDVRTKVIKIVQELLLEEGDRTAITPGVIATKIEMVVAMNPRWGEGLDRAAVTDELIRRSSLWIGQDTTLQDKNGDHVAWLNAARKQDWRYWQRYREYLERSMSTRAVDALDESTDKILGMLEDPVRTGAWDRRGLVVGHVQSGKTGNYTGLICKAADAGYKIIIVLAGLHNNLRSQTQMRLDEGFLGFETGPSVTDLRIIGVGEIDGDHLIRPNYATNRTERGDFSTALARNLGISPEQRPWLFVVKKNKTVLERLNRWLRDHVANTMDSTSGQRVITNLPLLLIDDEADHASVDTGEQEFNEAGLPDPEHDPTAINSQIRRILRTFTRAAYVGYTATPFANIFIHERGATSEEGPDLFPASFIHNLAAPSTYVGPARVFGVMRGTERTPGLPLVRNFVDHCSPDGRQGWMPPGHKNGHRPWHPGDEGMPPSMIQAIDAFILSCAVRQIRGQASKHMSMLVHVTRFNSVQQEVTAQIENHVRKIRQRLSRRIEHGAILDRLESLYRTDFIPTTEAMKVDCPEHDILPPATWQEIHVTLTTILEDLEVKTVNGSAKDALDYHANEGRPLRVIAVGGEKLSRGLTLEGLSVSYFLRASKMYDTLMQMGRWFGYRPGYLDVCRLYTTTELVEWFRHITDAAEELREEFDMMAASGSSPREYGVKVQSHPLLMVTSPMKMRSARTMHLSFSGTVLETVAFHSDESVLRRNADNLRRFTEQLGKPHEGNEIVRHDKRHRWHGFLWNQVSAGEVVAYLRGHATHGASIKVNSLLIAEFIESMARSGELTNWTVAIIGSGKGQAKEGLIYELSPAIKLRSIRRKAEGIQTDRFSIGRLLSDRDETIDLDGYAWNAALEETKRVWERGELALRVEAEPDHPSGPVVRRIKGFGANGIAPRPDRGLLLLYLIDPQISEFKGIDRSVPVVAFGVSFPGSRLQKTVEYKANNVLWEQEYAWNE